MRQGIFFPKNVTLNIVEMEDYCTISRDDVFYRHDDVMLIFFGRFKMLSSLAILHAYVSLSTIFLFEVSKG